MKRTGKDLAIAQRGVSENILISMKTTTLILAVQKSRI